MSHGNDITQLARRLAGAEPQAIIEEALKSREHVAISFSGAEDVVLIDMAAQLGVPFRAFSLDTGRLHPETYRYLDTVREHYGIDLEITFPEAGVVEALVNAKGLSSFYDDGHKECCQVRKVAPLRRKLATLDAWVTGQRRDQSLGTRNELAVVELDGAFSTPERALVKFNPLANWSSADVWNYIRANEVPYNPLHARGFTSIGCEPCTRPVLPNQHEREGRWWWENPADKECGLHAANLRAVNG
ncbi:MAG: phosphoadenylyl-sulfate reductase [Gammaproteobacteria bacterium]|nr:phosphoadenylyl-sulfate reductase [Gammaproteobacteria bacterium]